MSEWSAVRFGYEGPVHGRRSGGWTWCGIAVTRKAIRLVALLHPAQVTCGNCLRTHGHSGEDG